MSHVPRNIGLKTRSDVKMNVGGNLEHYFNNLKGRLLSKSSENSKYEYIIWGGGVSRSR